MSVLAERSLVVVFAYAPAGLGHLRVTDSLYEGLPRGVRPLLLGSQDKAIVLLHRILSVHPVIRGLFEWGQGSSLQHVGTFLYRRFLWAKTGLIYKQLMTIIDQRMLDQSLDKPTTVLVVATHFGLAHQIAAVKDRVAEEKGVRVILVVQVTDDSPQFIWYVPGADLILVPSYETKDALVAYGKKVGLAKVRFDVVPYPLSLLLARKIRKKLNRCSPRANLYGKVDVHVSVPISGAAVGTRWLADLIRRMHGLHSRFVFHVVSKDSGYTRGFLNKLSGCSYVKVYKYKTDREVVDAYEKLYQEVSVFLEITKPSEQAFKALYNPNQVGGSLLMFSRPVGRQEYDNLEFLVRHNLLPDKTAEELMFARAGEGKGLNDSVGEDLLEMSQRWRCMRLPEGVTEAARFINWCFREGIYAKMMNCEIRKVASGDPHGYELRPDGVSEFWKKVEGLI